MPKFKRPGYTQIPNEIFDEMMPGLSGSELKVLCLIARRTLGFHRDCFALSLRALAAGTGLSEQGVADAVKGLEYQEYLVKVKRFIEGGERPAASAYSLNIEGQDDDDQYPKNLGIDPELTPQEVGCSTPKKLGGVLKDLKKEEKERRETLPNPSEQNTENSNPETTGTDEIDPETGEPLRTVRSFKRNWKRPKVERPHGQSDRLRQMREGMSSDAQLPALASPVPSEGLAPAATPAVNLPARWNELVPERPVNQSLFRSATFGPDLRDQFDEVCAKAKLLIAAGGNLTFSGLLNQNPTTRMYGWQRMLAGEYDWVLSKKGKAHSKQDATSAASSTGGGDYFDDMVVRARRRAKESGE